LSVLGLLPEESVNLTGSLRTRLVSFLLRWEEVEAAAACLDHLIQANPALVSLLDLRARVQQSQGDLDGALGTMAVRHQQKVSLPSRSLEARLHLSRKDVETAHRIASELTDENPSSPSFWGLLGETELTKGSADAAERAYRRQLELSPNSRTALLGLMEVYRARREWVMATAYAVRAQTMEADELLSAGNFRRLRDFYLAAGDSNRAADMEAALGKRFQVELADLQEALAAGGTTSRRASQATGIDARTAPAEPVSVTALPTPDPPTSAERELIRRAVGHHFGFEQLLPGQVEIMAAVLRGEDVLAVLPTGGGKSLCYQLPALLETQGVTLVISPLIALMKDQMDSLPASARRLTTIINSSLGGDELNRRVREVANGRYRLVYAAPERLRQVSFLHALRRCGLTRLVIDEAHCVSLWGHDFRPDYLFIAEARKALGNPPLLAMTATAPERVRRDIVQRMGTLQVVATDLHRPNLRLEVFRARNEDQKLSHLLALCQTESGSGIVYAGTRERCELLAELLRGQGVNAGHYHAGIANRSTVQDDFMAGRVRVVVATIAFGLGIDKSDIRFIVHYAPPASVEAYYQEAGRAGRDGLPARCILLFGAADKGTLTKRANQNTLTLDFLRRVYRAVQPRGDRWVRVATDDLCRELRTEDTAVRVAISLLEATGLLRRHFDAPRSAVVQVKVENGRANPNADGDLTAFCAAARLRPGQSLEVDPVSVAVEAGLDPSAIEQYLLCWADGGRLEVRLAGRDLLLERLPAPPDASERVANLLEQYTTLQAQSVEEVSAYARTPQCRHGHVNAYLGGRPLDRCGACDNCLGLATDRVAAAAPMAEHEQRRAVMGCVADTDRGIGVMSLCRCLRSDRQAPDWTQRLHGYGALAFRSAVAVGKLVDGLIEEGLLERRELDHGGAIVVLTMAGRTELANPSRLTGDRNHLPVDD